MTLDVGTRESLIPHYLLSTTALALAVLSLDGAILRANRGFHEWLGIEAAGESVHVSHRFIHPTFASLVHRPSSGGTKIFEGPMTVGDQDAVGRSAQGHVHRLDDVLLVLAEPDVKRLEELAERVLELNEQLSARQRQLSVALQKLRRQEIELKELGATDALTGLANRRRFEARLERECALSRREDRPLTLMCLDLDHFKDINDAYGHPEGDKVLRELAVALRTSIRDGDLVARVGGEEFAAICPGLDGAASREAAERIRLAVKSMRVPTVPTEVTISIGVASGRPENAGAFFEQADRALYAAKRSGRDCVVMAADGDHAEGGG